MLSLINSSVTAERHVVSEQSTESTAEQINTDSEPSSSSSHQPPPPPRPHQPPPPAHNTPQQYYQSTVSTTEPSWTTGQGIGFLVALPSWMTMAVAIVLGTIALAVGPGDTAADADVTSMVLKISLMIGVIGMFTAIPGTIVFYKCKRKKLYM